MSSTRFNLETYRRVLREGHEAYRARGPWRECPYAGDERNGIWCYGAQGARRGLSLERTWANFQELNKHAGGFDPLPLKLVDLARLPRMRRFAVTVADWLSTTRWARHGARLLHYGLYGPRIAA